MKETAPQESDLMQAVVSLCKRRGFVFQSSEIYGGLKSAYDYGPLGVELKRNIMNEWWRSMVHEREDVVGIDASIIEVEVDASPIKGIEESFATVGLPDTAVRESRERVRSALRNSGYDIPPSHT